MRRFETLDGLRGFAALFVMLWHIQQSVAPNLPIMPSSYLAVDLFFLISGFVIANGYTRKLEGGMTFGKFAELRFLRLFPLFYVGCAIGLVAPILACLRDGGLWHLKPALQALPFALLMVPDVLHDSAFSLNPPGWSLFYELVINLMFAAGLYRLSVKRIAGTVLALGLLLVPAAMWHDQIVAVARVTWAMSVARTGFSFLLGALIQQLWREGRLPALKVPALVLIPAMMICMAQSGRGMASGALVMAAIALAFPLILVFAVQNEPRGIVRRIFVALGDLSYPIYAIHYPLMLLTVGLLKPLGLPGIAIGLGVALAMVPIAWLALHLIDMPLRDALSRRGRVRRASVIEAPAF